MALLEATGSLGLLRWQIFVIFSSAAGQDQKKPVWEAVALCIYYLQGIRQVLGALPGPSPQWLVDRVSRVAKTPGKVYLSEQLPTESAHLVLDKQVPEPQLLFLLGFASAASGACRVSLDELQGRFLPHLFPLPAACFAARRVGSCFILVMSALCSLMFLCSVFFPRCPASLETLSSSYVARQVQARVRSL